MPSRR